MKKYTAERIRNVAIVGHGGVGKTMLVEHLLYTAGAIERVGSVEAGSTQSDFDPLEVRRRMSLGAGVVPLEWNGCKINLIDVPGFPDFSGDLHGVARVVESMIVVCEAKRDLDVGFEAAWEVAERHGLAGCVFVNKLERDNADYEGLMDTLHRRYGRMVVSTQIPIGHQAAFSGVLDLLDMRVYKGRDRGVEIEDVPSGYAAEADRRREKMLEAACEADDALAERYLAGEDVTPQEIEHGLLMGIETGRVVPVLLGSAASGIGVATLLDRIVGEFPSPADAPKVVEGGTLVSAVRGRHEGAPLPLDRPLAAYCFKTTADPYVGKISFLRVFSGCLKADTAVRNVGKEADERIHGLAYPHGKAQEGTTEICAGDIGEATKLAHTGTGDTLSTTQGGVLLPTIDYPEPIYRVAIRPRTKADEDRMGAALAKLIEEDPTLRAYRDPATRQEILEGNGDLHLDAAIERLKARYGVAVETEEARVPYRETVRERAKAQGRHKRQTGGKGQFGDCWIELEPLERGQGFAFENRVVGGAIPKGFIPAIEKGIREAMDRGLVAGFPAVDLKVTVVDGSYHDVDSSEAAFKTAGALALRNAVASAAPSILEPVLEVEIEAPDDAIGDVVGNISGRRGRIGHLERSGVGKATVHATVPMASMGRYALDLRSLTKGRGRFRARMSHYEEAPPEEQRRLIEEHAKSRTHEE